MSHVADLSKTKLWICHSLCLKPFRVTLRLPSIAYFMEPFRSGLSCPSASTGTSPSPPPSIELLTAPPLCTWHSLGKNASSHTPLPLSSNERLLFFSLGVLPDLPGLDKVPFRSVSSSALHLPRRALRPWAVAPPGFEFLDGWACDVSSLVLAYSRCPVSAGDWRLLEVERPQEGTVGTHLFCHSSFLSFAKVCFLGKLPKLAVWSKLQGETSPYCFDAKFPSF